MGRTKVKKNTGEGEDGDAAGGGEALAKLQYTRALQKWKVESCYQLAARNYGSASVSSLERNLAGMSLWPTSSITLLSWLIERGLYSSQDDNSSVALRSIVLSEEGKSYQIEPWRNQTFSLSSSSQVVDTSASASANVIDLSINVGGPIWCTAFAPTIDPAQSMTDKDMYVNAPLDKYVAVGTSQIGHYSESNTASDGNHLLGQSETHDNLLQIWRIHGTYTHSKKAKFPTKPIPEYLLKKLKNATPNSAPRPKGRPRKYPKFGTGGETERSAPAEEQKDEADQEEADTAMEVQTPASSNAKTAEPEAETEEPQRADVAAELVYCVALQARGPTWSCAWSPLPFAPTTSNSSSSSASSNVLGVVAIVNGDGSCLILQLPRKVAAQQATNASNEDTYRAGIPVLSEAAVKMYEIAVPNLLVCSAVWNNENPLLCTCGMSDGSIMLWDLSKLPSATDASSPATTLSAPHRHLMDLQLMESQVPSMAAVRALQYCPYDSSLIATCGPEDVKIWSLKDSTGPLHAKRASSSLAAVAWDPTGYGYYYAEAETTSLNWNPLWGINMKHIFRKELYTHQEVCGGMWAIDAFVSEGISYVLSAASDGTVRGGYTSLMTCFKAKNTSTMQLNRAVSAYPTADGRSCVMHVEQTPRLLPGAIGTESFPQAGEVSVHALHSVPLGREPSLSCETTAAAAPVQKTPKKTKAAASAATPMVLDSDSEEGELEAEATPSVASSTAAKKSTPRAVKKRAATKSNEDDEDSASDALEDLEGFDNDNDHNSSSDSEGDSEADTPAKKKGAGKTAKAAAKDSKLFSIFTPAKTSKAKEPKSTAKSTTKKAPKSATKSTPAPQIATYEFNYTEEATQPASLRLVAYGGQSGLLRIHSFDPLRILIGKKK